MNHELIRLANLGEERAQAEARIQEEYASGDLSLVEYHRALADLDKEYSLSCLALSGPA